MTDYERLMYLLQGLDAGQSRSAPIETDAGVGGQVNSVNINGRSMPYTMDRLSLGAGGNYDEKNQAGVRAMLNAIQNTSPEGRSTTVMPGVAATYGPLSVMGGYRHTDQGHGRSQGTPVVGANLNVRNEDGPSYYAGINASRNGPANINGGMSMPVAGGQLSADAMADPRLRNWALQMLYRREF